MEIFDNLNSALHRDEISDNIKDVLMNFEENKNNLLFKRGIYIWKSLEGSNIIY